MKKQMRMILSATGLISAFFILWCAVSMQNLKITAVTTAEEFDLSGTVNLYGLSSMNSRETGTAVIRFMAVKNRSDRLFTRFGTGPYVQLGCDDLKVEHQFVSYGHILRIRLTLHAAQTDLKLENGSPFDSTRYSLRPVLTFEN